MYLILFRFCQLFSDLECMKLKLVVDLLETGASVSSKYSLAVDPNGTSGESVTGHLSWPKKKTKPYIFICHSGNGIGF